MSIQLKAIGMSYILKGLCDRIQTSMYLSACPELFMISATVYQIQFRSDTSLAQDQATYRISVLI